MPKELGIPDAAKRLYNVMKDLVEQKIVAHRLLLHILWLMTNNSGGLYGEYN